MKFKYECTQTYHSKTRLTFHMVWITKRRKRVLIGNINDFIERTILRIATDLNIVVEKLHVDFDHIHIIFQSSPDISIATIAKYFKGTSSRIAHQVFPELQNPLWAVGYFCATVGEGADEKIQKYLNHHAGYYAKHKGDN